MLMKKNNSFQLSVWLCSLVILLMACNDKPKPPDNNKDVAPDMTLLSNHLLSLKEAYALEKEYDSHNYKKINANRPKPDAKEIYYDIEVLENYLKYAKAEAKKQGIHDLGIVVTFAQYPEAGFSKVDPKYNGYQTVFFKTVKKRGNNSAKSSTQALQLKSNSEDIADIDALDYGQSTPPD